MLDYYPFIKLKISKKFPKTKLVGIMKPYLYLFLLHKYSTHNPEIRNRSYYLLKLKLTELVAFNPLFGRKQMVKNASTVFGGKSTYHMSFNDHCPRFTINSIKNMHYYCRNMFTGPAYHEPFNNNNNYSINIDESTDYDDDGGDDDDDDNETVVLSAEQEDYNDF
jgi:hypothetical protein